MKHNAAPLCLLQLHCHGSLLAPLLFHILRLVSSSSCSALLSFLLHDVVGRFWASKLRWVWLTLQKWKGPQVSVEAGMWVGKKDPEKLYEAQGQRVRLHRWTFTVSVWRNEMSWGFRLRPNLGVGSPRVCGQTDQYVPKAAPGALVGGCGGLRCAAPCYCGAPHCLG